MGNDLISKQEVLNDLSEPFVMSQCMTVEECEAMNRARKLCLARVENIEPAQRWIPVTERMPVDIDDEVLVCNGEYGKSGLGFVTVAIYDGNDWLESWERKTYLVAVTHWMPLPEPPKEEP